MSHCIYPFLGFNYILYYVVLDQRCDSKKFKTVYMIGGLLWFQLLTICGRSSLTYEKYHHYFLNRFMCVYQEGFFTMWLSNEGHKEIKYVGNL